MEEQSQQHELAGVWRADTIEYDYDNYLDFKHDNMCEHAELGAQGAIYSVYEGCFSTPYPSRLSVSLDRQHSPNFRSRVIFPLPEPVEFEFSYCLEQGSFVVAAHLGQVATYAKRCTLTLLLGSAELLPWGTNSATGQPNKSQTYHAEMVQLSHPQRVPFSRETRMRDINPNDRFASIFPGPRTKNKRGCSHGVYDTTL